MNLREQLSNAMQGNVVVMGIGNPCCGDDAAGSRVAQQICGAPGVRVIDAQDVPENYLGQVMDQRPDTILLIDCVDMKSAPGSVALFDEDRTTAYWPSTHRVPVCQLVDYLERTTNVRIFLIAIQPHHTGFLQPMSVEVLSSVEVITDVLNEVVEMRRMSAGAECASPLKGRVPA
ncbi:MAG: hydrogenase 3 maturation endopeptidase HyCI [Acidobacteriia bacterium]|nr:hydrogenase 3 maturation endopeptidase HyCI [Terriglobia bacterium]